ncbi:MAG: EAL domain-containing protein [Alphaproteobacteria bacterium]|nr:EAL domain-containing protein [Alphaproteobacteria bacterium]
MFFFSKNTDKKPASVITTLGTPDKTPENITVKKDTLIWDYLTKLDKDIDRFSALYIYIHKLQNPKVRQMQRQSVIDTFENVIKKSGGEIFSLPNDDAVVIFNRTAKEEILACLVKLRFLFHDDPLLRNAVDLEQIEFVKFFELSGGASEFRKVIGSSMEQQGNITTQSGGTYASRPNQSGSVRKFRRDLTPTMLSKVQKALVQTDFSSLIRRQSVCAVIGKSPPQMLFDEVFVSIADLRDMLLPDVDLTANPWLFLHLTETLDKRVLVSVSQHDDGSFTSNFSMNLNVSTILSDEFLEFDENMNSSMRSSIVLELQLVDIFSDIKAFILAKTFAQYRGYKICIDGITVDKLKYIDREHLSSDLIKIIWHPSFMDVITEDKHFTDYVNKAERAKMILCRVDDPQAVEVGNSLGINLYQGRYIQRLLGAQPKKTIYSIKK